MEAIAGNVIELLGSLAHKELELLCNFQDDLETMKGKMDGIRALLRDAEKKATTSETIKNWLQKLKEVLLDAEDQLDAYYAEELAREVMTKDKWDDEVRIFFSKSNRIVCAHKLGRKIGAIRKKIDEIYDGKNPSLMPGSSSSDLNGEPCEWRGDALMDTEREVVGREEERTRLVSALLNPDVQSDVSVVSIVGIGGSGKTTLAKLVYDDVSVKNHFELKMWVCVSDETHALSNIMLAQKIIGGQQTSAQADKVVEELNRKVEGKHFLLVLDDVWNIKDRGEWLKLRNLFRRGRKGSMIIVTTRDEEVAHTMGTDLPFPLRSLDEDESWELFCSVAFQDEKEPGDQKLVGIGKDIVGKCVGVPLAIKTIGSLLYNKKLEVREWSDFRDELANVGSYDNKILSILKLSYDHLPLHLKNCFAFCSLFPKDYEIERKVLIQMWIAEGFIQPLNPNRVLEDVGDEYFKQLLSRCLFQDVMKDDFGDIEQCKMHDLLHDVAKSIIENESYIVTSERIEEEKIGLGIRHVSSHFDEAWKFQFGTVKTRRVRTILSPKGQWDFIPSWSLSRLFNPICRSTTSLPKHLRVLDLSNAFLEIPESIGYLKQLRYLDLSGNSRLEKLPRGITKLHNLLSLRLNGCGNLIQLPRDMKRLVRLRHLELDYCNVLNCMPRGLGSLTNLQTLTTFVVDKRNGGGARISELFGLIGLRGGLNIDKLERQRSNIKELESSKPLLQMQYLERLSLTWSLLSLDEEFREEKAQKDEMILEALEPPRTIKILVIDGFQGKSLSKWIGSFTSLQELTLENCSALASLPESIGSVTSLQKLTLKSCSAFASLPESIGSLTSLQLLTIDNCSALASLPESIGSLTSLQKLTLYDFALASLPESLGSLTSLQELKLNNCSVLASLPESIGSLTSLQELKLKSCSALASLPESIGSLTSLQKLTLKNCSALASLPESIGSLTSLQKLTLENCSALASLPESIRSLTSLQELTIDNCSALASLPKSIGSLTSLQGLVLNNCSTLASLPESIGSLTSLQLLRLKNCSTLASLPESIGSLTLLELLRLNNCSTLASLPESIGSLTSLQVLMLDNCSDLASLPESIGSLASLQQLMIENCSALASLPESIGSLTSLKILYLGSCFTLASLPNSIKSLTSLGYLAIIRCSALMERYGQQLQGFNWPGLARIPNVLID